jgi:sigma-B regulation protein RsbU (phosphoserine phosphatase)
MVYALLNYKEGTLSFARAGHPYPLHVPAEGSVQLWQVHGSLLGVFDTSFPDATQQLRTGDKVLFYSDGIDSATFDGRPPGTESLLACAERHRGLPIQDFVATLAQDLFGHDNKPDDLTLLGVELLPIGS